MDWSPFLISLRSATVATIITFFLGIYAARLVMRLRGKIQWVLDALFTLPLVLPPTVAGFFLLVLFGKNGPMGKFFRTLGIQIIFTWVAAIIAAVTIAFPLMYRSAKAAFEQVDITLIHAGETLGMSEERIFWRIIMPLALPGVMSGGILAFARALGEFGATLMIAGNIPKVTQTMPIAIYMAVQGGEIKQAGVWVAILVSISFMVVGTMNHLESRGSRFKERGKKR